MISAGAVPAVRLREGLMDLGKLFQQLSPAKHGHRSSDSSDDHRRRRDSSDHRRRRRSSSDHRRRRRSSSGHRRRSRS